MRTPAELLGLVRRHAVWAVRDRFGGRAVVREVHGARMVLPWSHRLPDYTSGTSVYGRNLMDLAARLAAAEEAPLEVLDVGANVGDSALMLLHAAPDARVLCVEGDPDYLGWLHRNVDGLASVAVVEALLATEPGTASVQAVRAGGTTRFEAAEAGTGLPAVTAEQLRAEHPDFARLRLAKSDTDGYDVALVPTIAEAWADSRPVLFFEYDHQLSRLAGHDPLAVWDRLAGLGYDDVAVWHGGGWALGRSRVAEIAACTGGLEERAGVRARNYWDVAVVHRDDEAGRAVLADLVPGQLAEQPR